MLATTVPTTSGYAKTEPADGNGQPCLPTMVAGHLRHTTK
jgi:hypothetical protein